MVHHISDLAWQVEEGKPLSFGQAMTFWSYIECRYFQVAFREMLSFFVYGVEPTMHSVDAARRNALFWCLALHVGS